MSPALPLHAHPHDWLLPSRYVVTSNLEAGESAGAGFAASAAGPSRCLSLFVGLEGEAAETLDACRKATGEPKLKGPVPVPEKSGAFAVVLSKEVTRKIGGYAVGEPGLATVRGAQLGAAILALPGEGARVVVVLSAGLKSAIGAHAEEFLTGLLQRGVSLKAATRDRVAHVRNSTPTSGAGTAPSFGAPVGTKFHVQLASEDFPADAFDKARGLHGAMVVARSLVNMPGSALTPESYELFLRDMVKAECEKAGATHHIGIEVMQAERLAKEGCHLICAVGRASASAPRIVKLTFTPADPAQALKHVTLVGKGITFDTGGLDIKASTFMRNMKKDMGGSAAAFGSFLALARRGVPLRLTCYLAIAENMVSGDAMRPGDVYRARNGLTVEIDNTDAEGRLVLADALCLAAEENPDWIIDLATLTGAARTALGGGVDALFSNDAKLQDLVFRTGLDHADAVWPLPLVDDYEASLDSNVADMVNSASSPQGGAITAALFLRRFVGGRPWCHIDTYMWTDKPTELFPKQARPPNACASWRPPCAPSPGAEGDAWSARQQTCRLNSVRTLALGFDMLGPPPYDQA